MVDQDIRKNKDEIRLYYEYVDTYKNVLECIKKVKNKLITLKEYCRDYKNDKEFENVIEDIKLHIKEKTNEKNYLLSSESDLLYIIMWLERYLPYKDRYYSRKQTEELRKQTFNKASDVGVVLKEKLNINDVESLVHNKLLQNEMLVMLKELLTDKQYTCMYMYYYERFTQEQIADKLKIGQPNVANYIDNSIDKIRNSEYFLEMLKYLI